MFQASLLYKVNSKPARTVGLWNGLRKKVTLSGCLPINWKMEHLYFALGKFLNVPSEIVYANPEWSDLENTV